MVGRVAESAGRWRGEWRGWQGSLREAALFEEGSSGEFVGGTGKIKLGNSCR